MAKRDLTGAVDFSYLEGYAAGDLSLVEEVLGLFRQQLDIWLKLLDPEGAPDVWRDAAHSLKGSALGVGAFGLASALEAAERAQDADSGQRAVLLDKVRTALDAALADIAAYERELVLKSLRSPG